MDGAVGEPGQLLVVRNDDKGLPEAVAKVEEKLMELGLVLTVETARRLVGQDDGRVVDERPRHGDTLLLAARQLGRLVRGAVRQLQEVEQLHGPLARGAHGAPRNQRRNHHVLHGGELGQQLVELEHEAQPRAAEAGQLAAPQGKHVGAVDADGAAVRPVERTHDLQQRRLARTAGADDADDLAPTDVQVYPPEHLEASETFLDTVKFYHKGWYADAAADRKPARHRLSACKGRHKKAENRVPPRPPCTEIRPQPQGHRPSAPNEGRQRPK